MRIAVVITAVIPVVTTAVAAVSNESYWKAWLPMVLVGPLPHSEHLKYYVEPQIRLIDDPNVFNEFFFLSGLGVKFSKQFYLFFGPGWVVTKTPDGRLLNENRFWQQLNYELIDSPYVSLHNRSRLEERQDTTAVPTAWRFRERLWLRIPFHWDDRYSLSMFDEVFFNLNHPDWVSPYGFSQNRAFFGISYNFTHSIVVDFGYLNQYFHDLQNRDDHVLLGIFSVTIE
jgi:hypothetical protein